MQFVDPAHQRKIALADFLRLIVRGRACQRQNLALPGDRQIMSTVYHLFALSNPALPATQPPSNTPAARSSNCRFHSVTRFGWTSYCCAISVSGEAF
jgi:hypothetical protein